MAGVAMLLAACGSPPTGPGQTRPAPAPSPGTAPAVSPTPRPVTPPAAPAVAPAITPPPVSTPAQTRPAPPDTPKPQVRRHVPLGPAVAARSWDEFKLQAARRLVQSNPDGTYTGPAPDPLLAIPVLEVELNADGSVRRVQVLRHPRQATDTTQVAIDAVHRAAPYGAMSRLPLPWKWVEVFLFDDDRRFKPRELDK
jgi:hypothetical protein